MQRIKRHATYFTDRTKQNHWCEACYAQLNPEEAIVLDDGNEVMKKDLQEFKNDAVPEEGWVNCDECKTWVHQICALFNGRTNNSSATFTCPNCYVNQLIPDQPAAHKMKCAQDLPESSLSRAIEKGLSEALSREYQSRAKELGCGVEEVEKASCLTVRVLSNVDKNHYVGDEVSVVLFVTLR
jgi:E1A/CREB-binding protein